MFSFLTQNNPFLLESWQISLALYLFLGAWFISALSLRVIRHYAPSLKLVDLPDQRRIHQRVMPKGGGIGIFIALCASYIFGYCYLQQNQLDEIQSFAHSLFVIMPGALVIFLTGLLDDWYNLRPRTKLIFESLVAFWLIYHDIRITFFVDSYLFSIITTWLWVIVITNSFNLLDNMDGLSAGVVFISGAIFLLVAIQIQQWTIVWLLLGLLGATLGFLCYNFPPASMFMGDSGSLLLGYMMSVLTIHATFYCEPITFSIVFPILVLAVPLFDTGTVFLIRVKLKVSIFQGDKRHFSHRLVNLGLSQRHAVFVIYLLTFAAGISALFLYQLNFWAGILVLVQISTMLLIIHILERVGNQKNNGNGTAPLPSTIPTNNSTGSLPSTPTNNAVTSGTSSSNKDAETNNRSS